MAMSPTASSLLLTGVLLVVGLGVALLFSTVFLPQASPAVLLVLAAAGFLGLQLLIFRVLGLRSDADAQPDPASRKRGSQPSPADADASREEEQQDPERGDDWRAWRG